MAISTDNRDFFYRGEYPSLEAVWRLFPSGGAAGQYVTVLGKRYDWDELHDRWSDGSEGGDRPLRPVGPTLEGDLILTGDLYARDVYADRDIRAGRHLYVSGKATFSQAETARLRVTDRIDAKEIRLTGGIGSEAFAQGMLGWHVENDGTAELKALSIREFLEVPELRYNRISVIAGEQWNAPGGGIIEQVDRENRIIALKLEEGEYAACDVDDICKGVFHHANGFYTAFFRITEKIDESHFRYALREGYAFHPQPAMHFVGYGNFTNVSRQCSAYSSRSYTRYLNGVNDWEITVGMIRMQFGDLSNLRLFGIDMTGYSAYLKNIYMTGTLKQLSGDGKTEVRIPCPKGDWLPGRYYENDEVTHQGSLWWCVVAETTEEPSDGSTDWQKRVSKGNEGDRGETGLQGATIRMRGGWDITARYERNETFIDVVVYGGRNWHYAVREGADVPVGTPPTDERYWEEFNDFQNVATGVLLAENAWIDILDTNGIRIGENGWELSDGAITHKTSGLTLTADGRLLAPAGGIEILASGGYRPVDAELENLQQQIDGVIDSWYYPYVPTLDNYPASEWTSETERERHVGDTFTNTQPYVDDEETPDAGKSWRFVKDAGGYRWTPIADSDAVKALAGLSVTDGKITAQIEAFNRYGEAVKRTGIDVVLGTITLDADKTVVTGDLLAKAITANGLNINNKLVIDETGKLIGTDVELSGFIRATGGTIGGLSIRDGGIQGIVDDVARLNISTGEIPLLSEMLNGAVTDLSGTPAVQHFGTPTGKVQWSSHISTFGFTLDRPSDVSFRVSATVRANYDARYFSKTYTEIYLYILNLDTQVENYVYRSRVPASGYSRYAISDGFLNRTFSVHIPAGDFQLIVRTYAYSENGNPDGEGNRTECSTAILPLSDDTAAIVRVSTTGNMTMIGSNGLSSYWGPTKYFYLSQNDPSRFIASKGDTLFESSNGKNHIRITDNGIEITGAQINSGGESGNYVTEGYVSDRYTPKSEFNTHVNDWSVHVSAADRTVWNSKVGQSAFDAHVDDWNIHVSTADRTSWNGKVSRSGDTMTGTLLFPNGVGVELTSGVNGLKLLDNAVHVGSVEKETVIETWGNNLLHRVKGESTDRTVWDSVNLRSDDLYTKREHNVGKVGYSPYTDYNSGLKNQRGTLLTLGKWERYYGVQLMPSVDTKGLWYRYWWDAAPSEFVRLWDSENDGKGSGLDADRLWGYRPSDFEGHYPHTVDCTALDGNTWYPVTVDLRRTAIGNRSVRITVFVLLDNSSHPSWATHERGFSVRFSETVNGGNWGELSVSRVIHEYDYRFTQDNVSPIGRVRQFTNSSREAIYVRGGGKYFFYISALSPVELITASTVVEQETIAPITTPDGYVDIFNCSGTTGVARLIGRYEPEFYTTTVHSRIRLWNGSRYNWNVGVDTHATLGANSFVVQDGVNGVRLAIAPTGQVDVNGWLTISGSIRSKNKLWLGDQDFTDPYPNRFIYAYDRQMAVGENRYINFGRANSKFNSGEISFFYSGDQSTNNYVDVGLYSQAENKLRVYADGRTTIGPYVSGWTGSGILLNGSTGHAEVTSLTVRGALKTNELVANQIRATNGALAVTDAIELNGDAYLSSDGQSWVVPLSAVKGGKDAGFLMPFVAGDVLRSQRWNNTHTVLRSYQASCLGHDTQYGLYLKSVQTDGTATPQPKAGDVIVRWNSTVADRKGLLYLTSSDTQSPYLDVVYDGSTVMRVGRLDGIAGLSGWGMSFRSPDAFHITSAGSAKIGGFNLNEYRLWNGSSATQGNARLMMSTNSVAGVFYTGVGILRGYSILWHQGNNAGHVVLGQMAATYSTLSDYYGIQMMSHDSKEFFALGADITKTSGERYHCKIAGWNFHDKMLWKGNYWNSNAPGICLFSEEKRIAVYSDNNNFTSMYCYDANNQGISTRSNGKTVFYSGVTGGVRKVVLGDETGDEYIRYRVDSGRMEFGAGASLVWRVNSELTGARCLYTNPSFQNIVGKNPMNGISPYANSGGDKLTLTRTTLTGAPSPGGVVIEIVNTGSMVPPLGGFTWHTQSAPNKVYIAKIVAKIPEGYRIEFGSNLTGDGSSYRWLTPNVGTGKWETYIHRAQCGTGEGTYSTTNYFKFEGTPGTPEQPVRFYLAYATVFDATSTDGYSTHIGPDGLYTGWINANQITAGFIDAARISAGSITSEKLSANLILGTDAVFKGRLEAASGFFTGSLEAGNGVFSIDSQTGLGRWGILDVNANGIKVSRSDGAGLYLYNTSIPGLNDYSGSTQTGYFADGINESYSGATTQKTVEIGRFTVAPSETTGKGKLIVFTVPASGSNLIVTMRNYTDPWPMSAELKIMVQKQVGDGWETLRVLFNSYWSSEGHTAPYTATARVNGGSVTALSGDLIRIAYQVDYRRVSGTPGSIGITLSSTGSPAASFRYSVNSLLNSVNLYPDGFSYMKSTEKYFHLTGATAGDSLELNASLSLFDCRVGDTTTGAVVQIRSAMLSSKQEILMKGLLSATAGSSTSVAIPERYLRAVRMQYLTDYAKNHPNDFVLVLAENR